MYVYMYIQSFETNGNQYGPDILGFFFGLVFVYKIKRKHNDNKKKEQQFKRDFLLLISSPLTFFSMMFFFEHIHKYFIFGGPTNRVVLCSLVIVNDANGTNLYIDTKMLGIVQTAKKSLYFVVEISSVIILFLVLFCFYIPSMPVTKFIQFARSLDGSSKKTGQ